MTRITKTIPEKEPEGDGFAKVYLDELPRETHRRLKRLQIDKEEQGEKLTLKEVIYSVLDKGTKPKKTKN